MRIVFMGTPEFAVPSLSALINGPYQVVGVITQPDRPKGRHMTLTPPPVKVLAERHSIPVYQPAKVKDKTFIPVLRGLAPDLIVVVAYGQILSQEVLDIPPKGCINIHASLLPKYRGSSPVNWAIINGEKVSGVTSMFVSFALDSGPVLLRREVPIEDGDDASTYLERLSTVGGDLLAETVNRLAKGTLEPERQDESAATYFPMLSKSDGLIDWRLGAEQIRNRIRGLTPWPAAYTHFRGDMLKVYKAEAVPPQGSPADPGRIVGADEDGIRVSTGNGVLVIKELQTEGKRRMTAAEFIRGHKLEKGMVLGA